MFQDVKQNWSKQGLFTRVFDKYRGKSILMGALSLVLGSRADSSVVRIASEKCVVEAQFNLGSKSLEPLFQRNDLDWSSTLLLRREITGHGKSRAFINDTPVALSLLKEVGDGLVDIHAQHQNLLIATDGYPLSVIDKYGDLDHLRRQYTGQYQRLKELERELHRLEISAREASAEQDYLAFQLDQLTTARLRADEQQELENELTTLTYAEEIHRALAQSVFTLSEQESPVLVTLKQVLTDLNNAALHTAYLTDPVQRFNSLYLELQDITRELSQLVERIDQDPERLKLVSDRLDLILSLQQKHQVNSVQELIELAGEISNKLNDIESSDERIVQMKGEVENQYQVCRSLADELSSLRKSSIPKCMTEVTGLLKELGMPHGKFDIRLETNAKMDDTGIDTVGFYFTANKNQEPQELAKVASGGEISRLMLCIKSLISESIDIPTLIFDEIDSGVSGEIAFRMGSMIRNIGKGRQVLNITHLPQVAANGDHHYLVYKYDDEHVTHTTMRALNPDERITELAKMLSGEEMTDEAIQNAKVLLGEKGASKGAS